VCALDKREATKAPCRLGREEGYQSRITVTCSRIRRQCTPNEGQRKEARREPPSASCQRLPAGTAIVKRAMGLVTVVVAIMVATVVTIPISPAAVVIPMVVVFEPAARPFPVAVVEESTFVARRNPIGPFVRRTSPVSVMPFVALPVGVPVASDPKIARPRRYRPHCDDARRGWRPNANSDREIRSKKGSCGQYKNREQICFFHCILIFASCMCTTFANEERSFIIIVMRLFFCSKSYSQAKELQACSADRSGEVLWLGAGVRRRRFLRLLERGSQ